MVIEASKDPWKFMEFERQGWDAIIGAYEELLSDLTSQCVPDVLDLARVTEDSLVLDVCTGPGMLADAAVARGAIVAGLDFSSAAVACAIRNVPDAEFIEGSAEKLPFNDNHFDAVVCGFGIIHLPDPQEALMEMYRVLKPGGRVVVTVWDAPQPVNGFGLVFGAIMKHGNTDVPLPHGPDFFQFSNDESLTDALEIVGFEKTKVSVIEQTWELKSPDDLVKGIVEGTVRTRGLLLAQKEDVRHEIYEAIIKGVEQHRGDDGLYHVPMPALAGCGLKT